MSSTTVQRKLTALKHFPSEFDSSIRNLTTAGVLVNGIEVHSGKPVKEFKTLVDSKMKSIEDKIQSDHAARLAIAKSNSHTEIIVNGKTMTIMEALLYKQYQLPLLETLLSTLEDQEKQAKRLYADQLKDAEKAYKDLSSTPNVEKHILDNLAERNKPTIFSLESKIEELREKINFFTREFDALLSESNAVTQITV